MRGVRELVEDGESFDFVRLAENFTVSRPSFRIARDVNDPVEARAEFAHLVAHAGARRIDEHGAQIVRREIYILQARVLASAVEGIAQLLRR